MGYDGVLKMWDDKLQLVSAVKRAHDGARVHCLVVGPDGNLYTGGDDKVRSSGFRSTRQALNLLAVLSKVWIRDSMRCCSVQHSEHSVWTDNKSAGCHFIRRLSPRECLAQGLWQLRSCAPVIRF